MNRMQKKCLIGSSGFHLLLLVILLVGPAFFSSDRKLDDSQVITMVDLGKLTDGPTTIGGKPSLPPPAPEPTKPAPPAPQPPQPEPPAPQPEKSLVDKLFAPAPPKPDEPAIEPSREKVTVKPSTGESDVAATKKPKVEVTKKLVKKSATNDKTASAATDAARTKELAAARARAAAVSRALGNLREGLSSGTEVSVPGPGAGTFVNYKDAIAAIYERAWVTPTDATDDKAVAVATVTIARDGTVITAKIKTPSGDAATDRSVRDTLRRVKFTAPFPDGATDAERIFYITFDLKKKLLG